MSDETDTTRNHESRISHNNRTTQTKDQSTRQLQALPLVITYIPRNPQIVGKSKQDLTFLNNSSHFSLKFMSNLVNDKRPFHHEMRLR